jgi:eukaryotic-like serine/threonine-protein kinase
LRSRDEAREQLEAAHALASGPEGAPVHAAIVELELADALSHSDREQAEQLREQALTTLRSLGVRLDLKPLE